MTWVSRVFGVMTNEYAVTQCREKGLCNSYNTQDEVLGKAFKVVLALDVLEHCPPPELRKFLKSLNTQNIIVKVPCCIENGGDYVHPISETDPTHLIRLSKRTWIELFNHYKYQLFTIVSKAHFRKATEIIRKDNPEYYASTVTDNFFDDPNALVAFFKKKS